ncbi:MAG: hypothetical protein LBQ54_09855 [Planctomycetaceae bacterium]|nr:hypothetical protein [Planctomycetaceae bacterium]
MSKKSRHENPPQSVPESAASQEISRETAGIAVASCSVPPQRLTLFAIETFFIFAVFFLYGAWPVPDENEPNYILKAVRFWNPDWLPNDAFLNSANTHWLFYQTFGWLSLYFSPAVMTWIGRILLWFLLAAGWQRLSWTILAVPWYSVISAAAFSYFMTFYQMAGEWVIGGVEGKVFAYVFVFFGLNALVRNRWNLMWVCFGLSAGYHVLVGGWSMAAGGTAWLLQKRQDRASLLRMIPGLLIGAGLSLFGLLPGLGMDQGVPKEMVEKAHEIAVFERLPHHLLPSAFPWPMIVRMLFLTLIWLICSSLHWKRGTPGNRLVGYVAGAIVIAFAGFLIALAFPSNRPLTANLLQFYWFRLADFAIPLGVSLSAVTLFFNASQRFLRENWSEEKSGLGETVGKHAFFVIFLAVFAYWGFWQLPPMLSGGVVSGSNSLTLSWGFVLFVATCKTFRYFQFSGDETNDRKRTAAALFYASLLLYSGTLPAVLNYARERVIARPPRTVPDRFYSPWRQMCEWIADPNNTPEDAKFLVPRRSESFKWYANRSDIGVWKEMPQDAVSMVQWFETMEDCFAKKNVPDKEKWLYGLASVLSDKSPEEIAALQKKYSFDYILTEGWPLLPTLEKVYATSENPADRRYVLYKIPGFGNLERTRMMPPAWGETEDRILIPQGELLPTLEPLPPVVPAK